MRAGRADPRTGRPGCPACTRRSPGTDLTVRRVEVTQQWCSTEGLQDVTKQWLGRAAAVLVVGALLTGCGGAEPPPQPRAAESTAPPVVDPADLAPLGPADLPVPVDARARTPEGAMAFLHYYLGLINHTNRTMDPAHLIDLSQPACETCAVVTAAYQGDASAGYTYSGGDVAVDSMATADIGGKTAVISFVLSQAPSDVLDSRGRTVPGRSTEAFPTLPSAATLTWSEDDTTWTVASLDFRLEIAPA